MSELNGHSYAPVPGKIPGTPIDMGGREYIFAPLNLNAARKFEDVIPKLGQAPTLQENITIALPLLLASLQRNYPTMTLEDLGELIDFGNFTLAIAALVSISGYKKAAAGESAPAPQ